MNYRDRHGRRVRNDDTAAWLKPAYREMFRVLRPDAFCVSFYGYTKIDLFMDAWKSAGFPRRRSFRLPEKIHQQLVSHAVPPRAGVSAGQGLAAETRATRRRT